MFYLPAYIDNLLADTDPHQRDRDIREHLSELAPRLAARRSEYRHFGPYWWWVKPLLLELPATRRSWVRGGYRDHGFMAAADSSIPDTREDRDRWLAWLGLRYYQAEIVDETPASLHIVEGTDGSAFAYRLYDADASEQMDLFADESEEDRELQAFLADPVRFSGSAWLQKADAYIAEGDLERGAAALRRAVDRAVDETDRTTAWIRLGQLFHEHRHTRKAIFCYHNAWERDREGWIQGLIAEAYLDNDQPHEALTCYDAALAAMPGNPEYQAGAERCRRITREQSRSFSFAPESLAR